MEIENPDNSMRLLEKGMTIFIQRSDGRIQEAQVSSINLSRKCVNVDWFEDDEVRGKEVYFDAVLRLNKDLFKQNGDNKSQEQAKTVPKRVKTENNLSRPLSSTNKKFLTEVENAPLKSTSALKSRLTMSQCSTSSSDVVKTSKTVTEVENLQNNRVERRKAQEAKLGDVARKKASNPNWKFYEMIQEYKEGLEFDPLKENDPVVSNQITVCVRKRPLNKKENLRKEIDVITIPSKNLLIVHEPKNKVDLTRYLDNQQFRFDYVFDESCDNELVYKFTAKPLIETLFQGGNATCFAYGQTGSGKTHTMCGTSPGRNQNLRKGIYALAAIDVFNYLQMPEHAGKNYKVTASFYEIYGGKVFDLLAQKSKLRVLENAKQQVNVVGLTENSVSSVDHILDIIEIGNKVRTSGQTSANANSSRSHAVLQIALRTERHDKLYGKFSLIDLAGNERGSDNSSSNLNTRMEGAEINKSLLALKECIRALGRKGAHLPFRGSTLTQVLKDSFVGENNKTCMIAMISPGMSSCEHTLNTIRYADRVKELVATDPALLNFEDLLEDNNGNNLDSIQEFSNESIEDKEPQQKEHLGILKEELVTLSKVNWISKIPPTNDNASYAQHLQNNWNTYKKEMDEKISNFIQLINA